MKSSLPSRKHHNPLKRESTIQLHYFPEIPLNTASGRKSTQRDPSCFQPACYGAGDNTDSGSGDEGQLTDNAATPNQEVDQQAYNRGFTKGEKAGLAAAGIKLDETLSILNRAIEEVRKLKESIRASAEKEVVELALAVARKIVGYEVQINRDTVVEITKAALEKVEDRETITVKINPSDYRYLHERTSQMIHLIENTDRLTFVEDPAIDEGGCLIETDCGDVDARIENQFKIIEAAFRAELENAKENS